ncbi:hypothetical protein F5X71_34690 [Nocardia brasiliensis]|uniref:Uncharacterized protein n=1 Tax=Nocardia brasiliensis TaxID=37326 RepID=A0A6G9Y0T1_NOCBR|nr:hypothetical protein [Nocardia brasiliensis]QIS06774.1 hypothetical protein F5X71_34690 [Nocardia brasiliensis]
MENIRYTFGDIESGMGFIAEGLSLSERDTDLMELLLNAIYDRSESADITLDEVISNHYSGTPAEVRSWWTNWS